MVDNNIHVKKEGVILEATNLDFENEGVFNPTCYQVDDGIHMYYRAVSLGNKSSVGYCKLSDPLTVIERWEKPIFVGVHESESQGVEDPRITKIDDTFYLTYTAYDGLNAVGSLATSTDGFNFERKGIITPYITLKKFQVLLEKCGDLPKSYFEHIIMLQSFRQLKEMLVWDKDIIFFPKRINGKLALMHRIWPGIQIVYFDDVAELTEAFWEDYFNHFKKYIMLEPKHEFEHSYIGGGSVPIETPEGWLLIYHGVQSIGNFKIYHAAAALMDLNDPTIEISRLKFPLFSPERKWEVIGHVNNVVFPTGTAQVGDKLYIYYGAGDSRIGVVSLSFNELMSSLLANNNTN